MLLTQSEPYVSAAMRHVHNARANGASTWPRRLDSALARDLIDDAVVEIRQWPGYQPTPLIALDGLVDELGVAGVWYKDEATRFGLGSFKALGGAYAVLCLLREILTSKLGTSVDTTAIRKGVYQAETLDITVATATDGNHGRSVAWGAQQFGCRCMIYIHAEVSEGRKQAMESYGATVIRVNGNYDESVRQAAKDAGERGWHIVSDTSYPGYTDLPRQVMAGYGLMVDEVLDQLPPDKLPTHVFVQGGVGGLAAAVCARFWQRLAESRPRTIIVEPDQADCLYRSALYQKPVAVHITQESIMAGLSCGEVSQLAWDVLHSGANDFITIEDSLIGPTMRVLAGGLGGAAPMVGGESGVAGLAALIAVGADPSLAAVLGLDATSQVLLLGTEGATDPEIYLKLVGRAPDAV